MRIRGGKIATTGNGQTVQIYGKGDRTMDDPPGSVLQLGDHAEKKEKNVKTKQLAAARGQWAAGQETRPSR